MKAIVADLKFDPSIPKRKSMMGQCSRKCEYIMYFLEFQIKREGYCCGFEVLVYKIDQVTCR